MIDPAPDAVGLAGNNKSYLLSVNAEVMSPIIRSGIPPPVPHCPLWTLQPGAIILIQIAAADDTVHFLSTLEPSNEDYVKFNCNREQRRILYWGLLLVESTY